MAWPTSWNACRLSSPDSRVNFATDNRSSGACRAHCLLNSTRQPRRRSKSDWFAFVATMKLQGCWFIDDGAHLAASIKPARISGSTAVEAKARELRRSLIKASIEWSRFRCSFSRTIGAASFAIRSLRSD